MDVQASSSGPDVTAVRAVVEEHFPHLWPAVDLGLSTCATLLLKDISNPTAVIYVGGPSTGKTTVASMFEGAKIVVQGEEVPLTYRSDKFTPAAFVSQAANRLKKDLDSVDLLPRIKDKVLLTPELAPIFRGDDDELVKTFSVVTRILDGQGYVTDSGTHGQRGYAGPHLFAWIGCTTPFDPRAWRVMSQLGSRLFFLVMETGQPITADDLLAMDDGTSYQARHAKCKAAVHQFLRELFAANGGVRAVPWDTQTDTPEARKWIARCAEVLAAMRSEVVEERDASCREVVYRPGQREEPYRAFAVLTNVARGHALVHGRRQLSSDELPLIVRITVSTMPGDAGRIFKALVAHGGEMNVAQVQGVLGSKHPETARKRMEYVDALGVMEFHQEGTGRAARLCFRPNWAWCASPEFRSLLLGEPVKNPGACPSPLTPNLVEHLTEREEEREEETGDSSAHTPQEMTGSTHA